MKIISGGQTGIDRLALEVAREIGLETGGKAPKDFFTEIGPDPTLREFGLIEMDTRSYDPRTRANVSDADATVLFGNMGSPGSQKTILYCKALGKPYRTNPSVDQLVAFVQENKVHILNVAGNRRSRLSSAQISYYRGILQAAFRKI